MTRARWFTTSFRFLGRPRALVLNHVDGFPLQVILHMPEGNFGVWVFGEDEERGRVFRLVVKLTHAEVKKIVARDPYTVGFLEPVRATLQNREAAVLVDGNGIVDPPLARPFMIPGGVSETRFVELLDRSAESIDEYLRDDPRILRVPELGKRVVRCEQKLQGAKGLAFV